VLESQGVAGDEISTYRGLFYRNPALALSTAVFMFSLAGFPPTAGFLAKFLAFQAAVKAGHIDLVVIGVITSLISVFYYLRVVAVTFLPPVPSTEPAAEGEPEPAHHEETPWPPDLAAWTAVAGTIGLGIIPWGFLSLATESVTAVRAIFGLP
jgi:NADH-quinone oxidoreductase subunit N